MDAPPINAKILRKAESPDEYALYKAALEWGLADPIIINSREDLKSGTRWKDRVEPFHHQAGPGECCVERTAAAALESDCGLLVLQPRKGKLGGPI